MQRHQLLFFKRQHMALITALNSLLKNIPSLLRCTLYLLYFIITSMILQCARAMEDFFAVKAMEFSVVLSILLFIFYFKFNFGASRGPTSWPTTLCRFRRMFSGTTSASFYFCRGHLEG